MKSEHIFIKACFGKKVPYTPVWIMRQAGRYLPQYMEIKKKYSFIQMIQSPELSSLITIMPVKYLNVDSAIIFSDILIPLIAMGYSVFFENGIKISSQINTLSDVEKLKIPDPEKDSKFLIDAIKWTKTELKEKVPLIGFAGAPWTLLSYTIGAKQGDNFNKIKQFMYNNKRMFNELSLKLCDIISIYLNAQIDAGVDAVQIFDTLAGILSPDDYERFAFPYVKNLIGKIKRDGIPVIYFVNGVCHILEKMVESGADVIGIDWRIKISDAVRRVGGRCSIQGNLDPSALFAPPKKIREKVKTIIEDASLAKGHIFNLGHGILPETPPENAKMMVEFVHEITEKKSD